MARWVVSPVIGSGTEQDPYRLKVADYGPHAAVIPGNNDGTPMYTWGVAYFDGDINAAEGDGDIVLLPDLAPDEVVTPDLIPIGKGTVDMPNLTAFLTLRENVESIGQELDPAFTFDWVKLSG